MRENIGLFKAKDIETRDWREGCLIIDGTPNARKYYIQTIPSKTNPLSDIYEVDPETLCECVGQPDKNNKLIFENDKLRCAVEDPCTGKIYKYFDCIVKYCKTTNAWGWYGIDERSVLNKIPPQQDYVEVIGNKFEEVESEN